MHGVLSLVLVIAAFGKCETEKEYHDKFEQAFVKLGLQDGQKFAHWPAKPVGSEFNCDVALQRTKKAQNVNELTPYDIKVVGAMGDSISAAFGANGEEFETSLKEYRGFSWSIGGNYDLSKVTTLPNIIKMYNPEVIGFSIGIGEVDTPQARFNRAFSGAIAHDIPGQAKDLVERIRNHRGVDFDNDWKMVTLFIGGNNLCMSCILKDKHSTRNYVEKVKEGLDYLEANLPRTFVNLVQILDVSFLTDVTDPFCTLIHVIACPCKWAPQTSDVAKSYQEALDTLIESGRYDDKDDFTVVLQEFMREIHLPKFDNDTVDLSYFAPDCFHFSTKGHRNAAVSLWNNMFEPVGTKSVDWVENDTIDCPQPPYYFYTKANSGDPKAQLFEKYGGTCPSGAGCGY